MAHPIKGGAIIAGIGQTEFSKNSGRSELQLAAEASRAAILDAGLTPARSTAWSRSRSTPTTSSRSRATSASPG